MEKRNFFEELMQGFDELKREREGKLMLRNQHSEKTHNAMSTEGTENHQTWTVIPTGAVD